MFSILYQKWRFLGFALILLAFGCQSKRASLLVEPELGKTIPNEVHDNVQALARARQLFAQFRYREARDELEKARKDAATHEEAMKLLERISWIACELPAKTFLERSPRSEAVEDTKRQILYVMNRGTDAFDAGDFEKAQSDFEKALRALRWVPYHVLSEDDKSRLNSKLALASQNARQMKVANLPKALRRRNITLRLKSVSLVEALRRFRYESKLRVFIEAPLIKCEKTISLNHRNCSAMAVLKEILRQSQCAVRQKKGGIELVRKSMSDAHFEAQYFVGDLIEKYGGNLAASRTKRSSSSKSGVDPKKSANPRRFLSEFFSRTGALSWLGLAHWEIQNGHLIVFQNRAGHEQIRSFLTLERKQSQSQIEVNIYFVAIPEAFLKAIDAHHFQSSLNFASVLGQPSEGILAYSCPSALPNKAPHEPAPNVISTGVPRPIVGGSVRTDIPILEVNYPKLEAPLYFSRSSSFLAGKRIQGTALSYSDKDRNRLKLSLLDRHQWQAIQQLKDDGQKNNLSKLVELKMAGGELVIVPVSIHHSQGLARIPSLNDVPKNRSEKAAGEGELQLSLRLCSKLSPDSRWLTLLLRTNQSNEKNQKENGGVLHGKIAIPNSGVVLLHVGSKQSSSKPHRSSCLLFEARIVTKAEDR